MKTIKYILLQATKKNGRDVSLLIDAEEWRKFKADDEGFSSTDQLAECCFLDGSNPVDYWSVKPHYVGEVELHGDLNEDAVMGLPTSFITNEDI